jgi:hypothetical protein
MSTATDSLAFINLESILKLVYQCVYKFGQFFWFENRLVYTHSYTSTSFGFHEIVHKNLYFGH